MIYEYHCTHCNKDFEVKTTLSDNKPLRKCSCGNMAKKKVSLTNFKCDLTPKFH